MRDQELKAKAIELYLSDEKHQRAVEIITELLKGRSVTSVAQDYGISRQAVNNIKLKFVKKPHSG